ncbi:MAG: glycosyltransferase family 2 protein, partial [Planctomycetia bacterium]
ISVVIPIRNEAAFILDTLDELAAQNYPADQFEVIIVDGDSDDGTVEKVERFIEDYYHFQLLHNPKRIASAARNIGAHAAQGDVVVIVDGHCQIRNPSFLANIAEAFQESSADVLGRPQPMDISNATILQRAVAATRNSRLGHHPESFIYSNQSGYVPARSVGVAYRRDVFKRIGYFDETFDAHEDGEFNYRCDQAGMRCWFTPKIAVTYYPRNTLTGLFFQMIRYGRGRIRILRKHPETFGLGSFLPLAFLVGLVIGLPLILVHPVFMMIYLGCLAIYFTAALGIGVMAGLTSGSMAIAPLVPIVALVIHAGAGYGTLAELLLGKRKWKIHYHEDHSLSLKPNFYLQNR